MIYALTMKRITLKLQTQRLKLCIWQQNSAGTDQLTNLARSMASVFLDSVADLCALISFIISSLEPAEGSLYKDLLLRRNLNFSICLLGSFLGEKYVSVSFFFLGVCFEDCVMALGFLFAFLSTPTGTP